MEKCIGIVLNTAIYIVINILFRIEQPWISQKLMKKTFENSKGELITEQSTKLLDEYFVVYWENETIKKKVHFVKKELFGFIYYKKKGEVIAYELPNINTEFGKYLISYEDGLDEQITEQQVRFLSHYNIVYWENDNIKKKEYFSDSKLIRHIYYKSNNESVSQIISSLNTLNNEEIIIIEPVMYGEYRHEKSTSYNIDKTINWISNELYNSKNKLIAIELIDLSTGNPIYTETAKYYFDYEIAMEPDLELFTAYYDKNGNLAKVLYDQYSLMGQDGEYFSPYGTPGKDDIETLRLRIGVSFNYYLTASILPPPKNDL